MPGDTKIVGLWRDKQKAPETAPRFGADEEDAVEAVQNSAEEVMVETEESLDAPSPLPRLVRIGAVAAALGWLGFYGWFLFGAGFPKPGLAEAPSVAVTRTVIAPTSPLAGVPEKVRVAASKLSQAGSAEPSARVAV